MCVACHVLGISIYGEMYNVTQSDYGYRSTSCIERVADVASVFFTSLTKNQTYMKF